MEAPKFLDYLKFSNKYIVIPSILYVNLLLYFAVSLYDDNFWFPSAESIIAFGGNFNVLTLKGQWWRIICSFFLHYGALHFLANMYALTRIGYVLENFVGSWRLLLAYFFSGICAGIVSTGWHTLSVGAGASGAIFGLFGMFLALVTTPFVSKQSRWPLVKNISITIIINLIIGTQFHIDNAAHIGGLIGGIIAGYLMFCVYNINRSIEFERKRIFIYCSLLIILSFSMLFLILPCLSKKTVTINNLFTKIEKGKIQLIKKIEHSRNNRTLILNETEIMNDWNKLKKYSDELSNLNLEPEFKKQNYYYSQEIYLRKEETRLIFELDKGNFKNKLLFDSIQKELKKIEK